MLPTLLANFFLQCVLGTLVDAYFGGYDTILISDATATTSPAHGFDNVVYNSHAVRFSLGMYLLLPL